MDCDCGIADDAREFSEGLLTYIQQRAGQKHIPLNAAIELTLGCNIRCEHCYNFDRDAPLPDPLKQPLSPAEIKDLIGQLRAAGCLFLFFTGGEATLHPHFFEFVDEARRLHMSVYVLTNGTLIDEAFAARAATFKNISAFSVSLYGASAAVHDAVTQTPGSFERTWRGIRLLKGVGFPVNLKYIVMDRNRHEVGPALDHAETEGLKMHVDVTITGRHDGNKNSTGTRIDHEQVEELFRGPLRRFLPAAPIEGFHDEHFKCNCAQGNCAITATGEVQPCISVPMSAGNIRTQPFQEIWTTSPLFQWLRNLQLKDFEHCRSCDARAYCHRSPGGTYMATGNYTSADPWICKTTFIKKDIVEQYGSESAFPKA